MNDHVKTRGDREYDCNSVLDLLRFIRNMVLDYGTFPTDVQVLAVTKNVVHHSPQTKLICPVDTFLILVRDYFRLLWDHCIKISIATLKVVSHIS